MPTTAIERRRQQEEVHNESAASRKPANIQVISRTPRPARLKRSRSGRSIRDGAVDDKVPSEEDAFKLMLSTHDDELDELASEQTLS
ncbi:hypothetical protein RJ55_07869 [Drechmeria coniospora]|nr:hypothetical protein RJ55_07869 [Drechmeria coniospora]